MNKLCCLYLLLFLFFMSCKENKETNSKLLKIDKLAALEIAKKYSIMGEDVEIEFQSYNYPKSSLKFKSGIKTLYYWQVSKKCNNCNIIQIDAETGKVFSEGKYKYEY